MNRLMGLVQRFKPATQQMPVNSECSHLNMINDVHPNTRGCEECLASGDTWVHLRICMTCGHVGCCDDSKNKHATKHYEATGHPIMKSLEPRETWMWCFADKVLFED